MDLRAVAMGLVFVLMWSSAFTSAKVIVTYAPPLLSLALRFLLSGLIGVAIAAALGQSARLSRAQWRAVVIFGLCQNAIYLGTNFVAVVRIDAAMATIIASTMPLVVALASWLFLRERLPLPAIAGLCAGLVGVAIIMTGRIRGGIDLSGVGLMLVGVMALAAATLILRNATSGGNLLMVVGLQMLVGSAALWPFALFEEWQVVWTWQLGVAFAYTVLVPGLIATLVWFLLVRRIGAVRAATYHFLNPFFGVVVAALLLGEVLSATDILGVVIVTGGILAVQLTRARKTG